MGIGRGMITSLVSELLHEGVIYSGATAVAPRGRHPEMLYVRTRDRLVAAVDLRFSRTYMMLSDFGGREIAFDAMPTVAQPEALVTQLSERIATLLREHSRGRSCEGVGLVVPGMVDRTTGTVLNSPQLGWHDVDIRDLLSVATGFDVHIENAPIACALARMWLSGGDEKAPQNFVYVTVSDGVGAAVVVRGEVVRGVGNTAGEFGHVPLSLEGPRCLCGSQGCLEAYTSNLATVSRYLGHDFSPDVAQTLRLETGMTIDTVIERWRAGDEKAGWALHETARYLAVGLATIVNALNPAVIFVGGEITAAWELFAPEIERAISLRALSPAAARTRVIPEPPGSHPRLQGATALVAAPGFAAPNVA